MASVLRSSSAAGLNAAIVLALALFSGCGGRPSHPVAPNQPSSTDLPATEESIDKRLAKALAGVDPSLIYERTPIPDERNAFPLWTRAMANLVPLEGAEKRARRLKMWREEIGSKWLEIHGWEPTPSPGLLRFSAKHTYGMPLTDLELFYEELRKVKSAPEGDTARAFMAWLDHHQEVFDLIDEGLARDRLQFPEPRYPSDGNWSHTIKDIAVMRMAKGRMLAWREEFDAAARELVAAVKMGAFLAGGEEMSASFGEASVIFSLANCDLTWLLGRPGVPESTLAMLVAELPLLRELGDYQAQSFGIKFTEMWLRSARDTMEQTIDIEMLRSLGDEEKWDLNLSGEAGQAFLRALERAQPVFFDPDETFDVVSRYYVRFAKNATGTWKGRIRGLDSEIRLWREGWDGAFKEELASIRQALAEKRIPTEEELACLVKAMHNIVGRALMAMDLRTMDSFVGFYFEFRAEREAVRAVVALRLHEVRHGKLPAKLSDLVAAGILDAVPRDVYSGDELLYSRERRVVWSVDADEIDDGGASLDAERPPASRKDFVMSIPVPDGR